MSFSMGAWALTKAKHACAMAIKLLTEAGASTSMLQQNASAHCYFAVSSNTE